MHTEKIKVWNVFVYSEWLDHPDYTETYGDHPIFLSEDIGQKYVDNVNKQRLEQKHLKEKIRHQESEARRVVTAIKMEAEHLALVKAGLRPSEPSRDFHTSEKPYSPPATTIPYAGHLILEEEEITIAY